jgi:hypothetical protein
VRLAFKAYLFDKSVVKLFILLYEIADVFIKSSVIFETVIVPSELLVHTILFKYDASFASLDKFIE